MKGQRLSDHNADLAYEMTQGGFTSGQVERFLARSTNSYRVNMLCHAFDRYDAEAAEAFEFMIEFESARIQSERLAEKQAALAAEAAQLAENETKLREAERMRNTWKCRARYVHLSSPEHLSLHPSALNDKCKACTRRT
jgi:hypothetical protein